jgi:hypothetical protein
MSNWTCCTLRDGGVAWLNMDRATAIRPANAATGATTKVFFAGEEDPWEINETLVWHQGGYWIVGE